MILKKILKIKNIFSIFTKKKFNFKKRLEYYKKINLKIFQLRNIGSFSNIGQKNWELAKKIIPGGNSLISKRPEQFIDNIWPCYFKKNKRYLCLGLRK